MTDHLLAFVRDPGATNQILALLRLIRGDVPGALRESVKKLALALPFSEQKPIITILAKDYACERLSAENTSITCWEHFSNTSDPTDDLVHTLQCKLIKLQATHVLTGVSDNDDKTHQKIWRAARLAGIPSTTLLDDDVYQPACFMTEDGECVWPDHIYALSEQSRTWLQDLGIPDGAVRVIANLHLTWLTTQHTSGHLKEALALRRAWGANIGERIVLFASQPIREMAAFGKPINFDEFACLEQLSRQLNLDPITSLIVIRPHPRDAPGKYEGLTSGGPPRVIISDQGSSISAILAADTIAGMTSMLLNEAKALSRPIIYLTGEDNNG